MRFFLYCFLTFLLCQFVSGKVFTRCGLAQELKKHGFPKDQLPDWVCLVEKESSRDTNKKGGPNKNGSYDWGLFQINDGLWCKAGDQPGKDCNVKCSSVMGDDITIAAKCAQKVFKRHGFRGWYGWKNHCQGTLPDLSKCNL